MSENSARTAPEIERKFLVRDAALGDCEDLTLKEVESTYLDLHALSTIRVAGLPSLINTDEEEAEVRVSRYESDGNVEYNLIHKFGGRSLSRMETVIDIDKDLYYALKSKFGISSITKKRFTFDYLRQKFELDVFPELRLVVLEIELKDEKQLVALPPFVEIIREVTGDPDYYNINLSKTGKKPS